MSQDKNSPVETATIGSNGNVLGTNLTVKQQIEAAENDRAGRD